MTKPILIFPHIAKTGGTTLHNHLRVKLGDEAIMLSGRSSRMQRFLSDRPQIEETDPAERSAVRLIQGHGVNEQSVKFADGKPVRFLIVLRHPVGLTRSRFNHFTNMSKRRENSVNTDKFLQNKSTNAQTESLIRRFPSLIDDPEASNLDKALSILKKFHYVLTTEELDSSAVGLLQDMGVETKMERRRVAEAKTPLDVDDEFIRSINQDDLALHEAVSQKPAAESQWYNPLGFDQASQEQIVEKIQAQESKDVEVDRLNAYRDLALILSNDLAAETALAKLDSGGAAIERPDLFRSLLEEQWERKKQNISPEGIKKSEKKLRNFRRRTGLAK